MHSIATPVLQQHAQQQAPGYKQMPMHLQGFIPDSNLNSNSSAGLFEHLITMGDPQGVCVQHVSCGTHTRLPARLP